MRVNDDLRKRKKRSRDARFLRRRNLEGEIPPSMVEGAVL